MRTRRHRCVAFGTAFLLVLGTVVSVTNAAPAFRVLRSTDPAAVRTAEPVATTHGGPFDDTVGLLDDGIDYYYVIKQGASEIALSVHRNDALGTVRLGFDDGLATSASADAFLSEVLVSPPSVPADGVTSSTVTVVPRDVSGVPLGRGLALAVDSSSLLPGVPSGPLTDHGDGRYSMQVTSVIVGSGTIDATVEGTALGTRPSIDYDPVP